MYKAIQHIASWRLLAMILTFGPITASVGAGTIKFANTREMKQFVSKPSCKTGDTIYGLAEFDVPLVELFRAKRDRHTVVVKLSVDRKPIATSVFFLTGDELSKVGKSLILEIAANPNDQSQNNFKIPRTLGGLPAGKHRVDIAFWSLDAKDSSKNFAEGSLTLESSESGNQKLLAIARAIEDRKQTPRASDPYAGAVAIRRDGSILLYLRGNEIVKDGAVVGRFEKTQVRKNGSIVGEIRGKTFRHEGTEVWKLDKGNLYSGIEVRLDGSIVGDIRADGRVWREGSAWGSVKPYQGTEEETMRVVAALYYFSDFLQNR